MRKRNIWLPNDIEALKVLYSDTPMFELMKMFDRDSMSISNKAFDLGLKRSAEFLAGPFGGRIRKGERIGSATQFKKGFVPLNKGKKQTEFMSAAAIEKTKATRFKKGNEPHNTKPIGHERITKHGYVEVKVRNAPENGKNKNFELKHRLVWEEHHGPIPIGMNVEFLPGADKINFTINDLVLRSRYDNMISNSFCDNAIVKRFLRVKEPELIEKIKNEAHDLIDLKRKSLMLNQKINKQCQ